MIEESDLVKGTEESDLIEGTRSDLILDSSAVGNKESDLRV